MGMKETTAWWQELYITVIEKKVDHRILFVFPLLKKVTPTYFTFCLILKC